MPDSLRARLAGRERAPSGHARGTPHLLCRRAWLAFSLLLLTISGQSLADDGKVDEFIQELFLGEVVYPQDAGEIQFTTGFLWRNEGQGGGRIPLSMEYGITDYFQLGVQVPLATLREDDVSGVGHIEFEAYCNLLNDPESGWAAGLGFGLGLPTATPEVAGDAYIYEPFLVVYRELSWGAALNFSAGLEIDEPRHDQEPTGVAGELATALLRRRDAFVFLLEAAVEIDKDEAPVSMAPGAYWQPAVAMWELGVSMPVTLADTSTDVGVFVLFNLEFGGRDHRDGGPAADDN